MRVVIEGHPLLPVFSPAQRGLSRRLTALYLLVALVLIATLVGPSAFVIAKQTGVFLPHGIQASATHPTSAPADHHSEQLGKSTGKDGDSKSSKDPKRPRGVLGSKGKVGSIFAVVVPPQVLGSRIEHSDPLSHRIVGAEAEPENNSLPPQLLQRPPPHEGQVLLF